MTDRLLSDDNAAILIAYGSNLPFASALPVRQSASQGLEWVVKTLRDRGVVVNKISRLWHSLAWPNPDDPPYFNAVLEVKTRHQPAELLRIMHDLEAEAGRVRDGRRNAPRVLDLDLIAHGRTVQDNHEGVVLPHPRAHDRAFVMGPLAEILPHWRHPVSGETAMDLWRTASVGRDAHPADDDA